jgi:hypothetical protein
MVLPLEAAREDQSAVARFKQEVLHAIALALTGRPRPNHVLAAGAGGIWCERFILLHDLSRACAKLPTKQSGDASAAVQRPELSRERPGPS